MLPDLVSYHYVNHQYDKPVTIEYLRRVGSTKQKFKHTWCGKLLTVSYLEKIGLTKYKFEHSWYKKLHTVNYLARN